MATMLHPPRCLRPCLFVALAWWLIGCSEMLPQRTPGEKLYRRHCAECHGLNGSGQTVRSMGDPNADLLDDSWRHAGDAPGLVSVLTQDLVFEHPTFSQRLSSQEARQIVDHLLTLRGERAR